MTTRQGWQCPLCEVVHNPETKWCECVRPGAVRRWPSGRLLKWEGPPSAAPAQLPVRKRGWQYRSGTAGRRAMDHMCAEFYDRPSALPGCCHFYTDDGAKSKSCTACGYDRLPSR